MPKYRAADTLEAVDKQGGCNEWVGGGINAFKSKQGVTIKAGRLEKL